MKLLHDNVNPDLCKQNKEREIPFLYFMSFKLGLAQNCYGKTTEQLLGRLAGGQVIGKSALGSQ